MIEQCVLSSARLRYCGLAAFALTAGLIATPLSAESTSAAGADPILIENSVGQVRRSDYEAELLRLSPDVRGGFATSERRVRDLLIRMLVTKTLAVQAHDLAIDRDPEVVVRIRLETERALAQLRLARVEEEAAKEFDAKRASFEPRARELYVVDRKKYEMPEQVTASHILFSVDKHSREEGLKLAQEARARVLAGADFSAVARQESEDPTARTNGGDLGWFARGVMDPAFSDAAFVLVKEGDLSPPVLSRFGWHVIRLDGRRPAGVKPYDEVKDQIMSQLRQKYVTDKRDDFLRAIGNDPKTSLHEEDVAALFTPPPDDATIKRLMEAPVPAPVAPAK